MTATVKPFPVARQLAFVRETAELIERKQGAAADRFWQMTCRRLYARLQVQGFQHDEIMGEVHAFSNAVHQRLDVSRVRDENPKGAA